MTRKKYTDHARTYRDNVSPASSEVSFQTVVEQTDLFIVAEKDLSTEALNAIHEVRSIIKCYSVLNPQFSTSLVPIDVLDQSHPVIIAMAKAAAHCSVGPMAAVAGAVAQYVADKLRPVSANVLVENGGDIYMHSTVKRKVALLSEPDSGAKIGMLIDAEDFPLAICSSSGTIGHSLSLGSGDLVTVRAKDAHFADAAATALANMLKSPADVPLVIEKARTLTEHGLDGIFVQYDSKIGAWGDIELVAL
ncbi:UPF0280 family protein [Maridesulfovibrio hydrothermalis]|uniref:ApbE family lipoprotein n=1 Tax=Maridesulfovibrio hydrothermalis AM13 = DSM 14728 TaxID=1121451 RepID=L0RF29_9BACT|nr:UPF0280 family protein [Maridesulfovibrio hydrothermalis]CCO25359.1 ApbE family lipoprotein [Maridesulfovibrio hydrothermalis AM13 = DSM 14728]